ncbi:hypothetical protein Lalb_Chr15g0080061 [Lupinus albus]|uniref:Uncharacterized protein n=1 Tax=Lupinus albus TaxID=3870 RepID=A0A6A4P8T6_LUPAL|nr:hypothetical protein Lalb_Chr15g0080061 [Lupinus albus]
MLKGDAIVYPHVKSSILGDQIAVAVAIVVMVNCYCDCGYCGRCDSDCGCCSVNYFVIKTIFLNLMWSDHNLMQSDRSQMRSKCDLMWLCGQMQMHHCDSKSHCNYGGHRNRNIAVT